MTWVTAHKFTVCAGLNEYIQIFPKRGFCFRAFPWPFKKAMLLASPEREIGRKPRWKFLPMTIVLTFNHNAFIHNIFIIFRQHVVFFMSWCFVALSYCITYLKPKEMWWSWHQKVKLSIKTFWKISISKFLLGFSKKKKFWAQIFQNFFFKTPKILFWNDFWHQKRNLHEGLIIHISS